MFGLNIRKRVQQGLRRSFEIVGSDAFSHMALNGLDRKLARHLPFQNGTFVEAGANNGLDQSNTYWFERFRGWRGVLVEAVPDKAAECRRNRPHASVVNAALVADDSVAFIRMKEANLMAYVSGSIGLQDEKIHVEHAMRVQKLAEIPEVEVPARTLASILTELRIEHVDLFSLDVEGYELEVLKGMDVTQHAPAHILVETKRLDDVLALLGQRYEAVESLSYHDHLLRLKA